MKDYCAWSTWAEHSWPANWCRRSRRHWGCQPSQGRAYLLHPKFYEFCTLIMLSNLRMKEETFFPYFTFLANIIFMIFSFVASADSLFCFYFGHFRIKTFWLLKNCCRQEEEISTSNWKKLNSFLLQRKIRANSKATDLISVWKS